MKKILVFGSLNMDLSIACNKIPQAGETITGHDFIITPGGKGGNQIVAAAKLGAQTVLIGAVGEDLFGEDILRQLREVGVNCEHVSKSPKGTGVAVIACAEGDNRIILSPGANHALGAEEARRLVEETAREGDLFMTQYECDHGAVLTALHTAREKGLFTIFNPAPASQIPEDSYRDIDLLVVNQTECAFLTGIYPEGEKDTAAAYERLHQEGMGALIVTLGEKGSVYQDESGVIRAHSYQVPNVDTTAAGDCYIGGLAAAMCRGSSMSEAMDFASRAAALTVTKRGAQQSIPFLNEVETYQF